MLKELLHPISLAILLLASASCSDDGTGPADSTDIGSWMEFYEVPGVSVAVIKDFALDYVAVHGVKSLATREPVTEQTLFQAASISKAVSAVGAMRLVQQGQIALDTDINDYLTSWQLPHNDLQDTEKVTLRRLLSHTAGTTVHGFRGYRYGESVPTLIQILEGAPPSNSAPIIVDREPGSGFQYSGGGYVLMQLALMDITGDAFPDLMIDLVFQPIGMDQSTFEQPLPESWLNAASTGYYASGQAVPGGHHIYPEMAAAGLWTTPADLAQLLIELQLSLRGESNSVLSRESVQLLLTAVSDNYALGFGVWSQSGEPYFGHGGANDGFRCNMVAHRSDGFGVVVMTNSDNGSDLADAVVRLIGDREGWPGY